jgi:hypothetical protein
MVWDTKHVVLAIIATAAIILAVSSYREEQRDRAQLADTLAKQDVVIAGADKRIETRDQAAAVAVQRIETTEKRIQTPSGRISALNADIPLPSPVTLNPAPNPLAGQPTQAPSANIPAEDLQPLEAFAASCKICQIQLTTCQQDLADAKTKNAAEAMETKAAVAAVKGGTFWARLKHNAKVVGITAGGVIVAVLVAAAHK